MRITSMKLVCAFSLVVVFAALAQDRKPDYLREANVTVSEYRGVYLDDGGCTFIATGVGITDGGVREVVISEPADFSGARCTTLRAAGLRAVKRALNVGNGAVP